METPREKQSEVAESQGAEAQATGTAASSASSGASSGNSTAGRLRGVVGDAIRYWELRRIVYNVVLIAVAGAWLVASWPHFRPALTLSSLLILSVLALLANVCYCAAYVVDIPLRASIGDTWKRWRWGLWVAGMLFAVLFENYWIADEIYPYVK